jgi:hypothetical protein
MSDPNSDDRGPTAESDAPEGRTPAETDSGTGAGDRDDPGRDPRDDSTQIANEERRRSTPFISAIVAALGAWVALSVLIYDFGAAALWNNVLVGAVVFAAGAYNYYRLVNDVPLSVGVASLVALLGIWLIIAPALFGVISGFWSTLASGLLIAGLAGYNAYEAREAQAITTDAEPEAP